MSEFKPMLAVSCDPRKLRFPLYVQPKLDGIRASVVGGRLLTRTLKQVPNREIYEALSQPEFDGLDGELIVGDPTAGDCYRKTASFCMSGSKTGAQWTYFVFDRHDLPGTFVERFQRLSEFLPALDAAGVGFEIVPTNVADDAQELEAIEQATVALGHEGLIARQPGSHYKYGRASKTAGELVKLKRYVDFEAKVVGVFEEQHNGNAGITNALGRTERSTAKAGKTGKGSLGGLVLVAMNGPSAGIEFRCGTGFDAAERASLWAEWQASPFIDRVATVKSFPIGVLTRPRHPVFLHWREDSDLPDPAQD